MLRDEALRALEKVVALAANATPGPWEALTPCEPHDYLTDIRSDDDGQLVASTYTEHDGRLVSAAVNFIREHSRAILSARQEVAPVAWMAENGTVVTQAQKDMFPESLREHVIPLYTSPAHTSEARDAARLDWLEKHGCWQFAGPSESDIRGPAYRWFDYDTDGHDYSATLREAIDAAMRQEGGNG